MEVTINQVEKILNTLPISLYAKRLVDVDLSNKIPTSCYNMKEDRITISYNNIKGIIHKLHDEKELESTVRALLYHEISHAILTPVNLYGRSSRILRDAINIFEDERIETLFKDYYSGVNFKRNIIMIMNWKNEPAENLMEDFFNICRFRAGKDKYVSRVSQMIKVYDSLTQDKNSVYDYNYRVTQYNQSIIQLFLDVAQDWLEENEMEKLKEEQYNYEELSDEQKKVIVQRILEALTDGELDEMEKRLVMTSGMEEGEDEGEGTKGKPAEVEGEIESDKMSDAELNEILDEIERRINSANHSEPKDPQKLLDSSLNKMIDKELIDNIKEIFNNFLSRTKNNAGAIQRYSGVLNPRAVGREDWRIFEYKAQNGPVRGYDKLHLNLFIDTSGSYRNNQDKTNTIIKALDILEDTYPFFEFDLVTCQVGEQKREKGKRYIEANGGNYLDNKIFGIFKELQYTNALNYNIVLFDGDAFTDCYRDTRENAQKNFAAFNTSKCSIISDDDNEKAIKKYAPLAASTFVNYCARKSYADMLYDNVLTALQRALL